MSPDLRAELRRALPFSIAAGAGSAIAAATYRERPYLLDALDPVAPVTSEWWWITAMALAALLGLRQWWDERDPDVAALHRQRPVGAGRIFRLRCAVAMGAILLPMAAVAAGCTVAAAWLVPARPLPAAILLPHLLVALTVPVAWAAGVLTAVRRARWHATLLLPVGVCGVLLAAILAPPAFGLPGTELLVSVLQPSRWSPLMPFATAGLAILLLALTRAAALAPDRRLPDSLLAPPVALALGLALQFGAIQIAPSGWWWKPDAHPVVYHGADADGRVLRGQVDDAGRMMVERWDPAARTWEREDPAPDVRRHRLDPGVVLTDGGQPPALRDVPVPGRTPPWQVATLGFGPWREDGPAGTAYFIPAEGGLPASGPGREPPRFPAWAVPSLPLTWSWRGATLFVPAVDAQERVWWWYGVPAEPLLATPGPGPVAGRPLRLVPLSGGSALLLITSQELVWLSVDGRIDARAPHPPAPSAALELFESRGRTVTAHWTDGGRSMWARWDGTAWRILLELEAPAGPDLERSGFAPWTRGLAVALAPILRAVAVPPSTSPYAHRLPPLPVAATIAGVLAACALLALRLRRHRASWPAWCGWLALGLLTGAAGLLAHLLLVRRPPRAACPACARARPVSAPVCPGCGAGWTPLGPPVRPQIVG